MNFGEAIASGFSNYVNFSSRAARSEYWYWVSVQRSRPSGDGDHRQRCDRNVGDNRHISLSLYSCRAIAVAARRLHDVDRTGWWLLLAFVPVVGLIVLLIWFCTKGTERLETRFGPRSVAWWKGQVNPRPGSLIASSLANR